jgi:DNA-binding transcriptional MerR regulator
MLLTYRLYWTMDAWGNTMFKIGEFARISQVPTTALRYYDERGLLVPAHIDPTTGYRYYAVAQLGRLNRILALRDLGLSLEQIAMLLDEHIGAAQLRGMLRLRQLEQHERVREEQARLRRVETRLRDIEQEEGMPTYDVVVKTIAPQRAATRRAVLGHPTEQGRLFEEIETALATKGVTNTGFPVAIYHDMRNEETEWDIETAIPTDTSVSSADGIATRQLDGIDTAACVVHEGPYEELHAAYAAVFSWIEANNYRVAGPCREVNLRFAPLPTNFNWGEGYLADDPSGFVTEVQVPVERA